MTDETLDSPGAKAIAANPWHALRRFTDARIALGRAGASLPTAPLLALNLAHAQARDAVHTPFDTEALKRELDARALDAIEVRSAAHSREQYLRRPDLGRVLDAASAERLARHAAEAESSTRRAAESSPASP